METLQEYRHVIDKKTKQIFLKAFKSAIGKIDKKKFGFIGIVGSIHDDRSHDIDIVIFPNFKVKIGEAIIEYSKLYNATDKELKKYHKRYYMAATQKFAMQELVYHLSASQEGSAGMVPIHSMFFTNYRDFKKLSPKGFIKAVEKDSIVIHGSLDLIKDLPTISQKKLEPYFFVLDFEMNSRIKTFPKHLIRSSAEALFDYLEKKYGIKTKNETPHDINKIEKELFRMLRELDKRTYG